MNTITEFDENGEMQDYVLLIDHEELKDFAIWMTGCGYDFTKSEYFIKQRDKLLKN